MKSKIINFKSILSVFFAVLLYSCTTNQSMSPELTTILVSQIDGNKAIAGGQLITDGGVRILQQGVCWDTIPNPTILKNKIVNLSGKSLFSDTISGLLSSKTYYVRAYATNFAGTSYGTNESFTTQKAILIPVLITNVVTSITNSTATSGGTLTSDGGAPITARGVCWSTSASPTVALSTITSNGVGLGVFTSSITGLLPATTYHVRAYATNKQGTAYGQEQTFVTAQTTAPVLTTSAATFFSTTAQLGGNVTSDGGATITARGVCWSTAASPTILLNPKTSDGTGTGTYTSNLTGLTPSTLYHVRAYATNAIGTSYGNEVTFTTSAPVANPTVPALSTTTITSISGITAVSGGNISTDGGSAVTFLGICWSTSAAPTTALSTKTSDGIVVVGPFTSYLTGLTPSTLYHVRAYATNAVGTAYGSDLTFTTSAPATIPILTTTAISTFATTTATSGGNISADGGATVTARGVCWNTSTGPTIANTKTTDASGTGSFTSSITGLTGSTKYYVRAYATNAVGTAYGNEVSFATLAPVATGTLTVSMTVTPARFGYGMNGVAVWITNSAGVYIKSLIAYATAGTGQRYLQYLTLYNKARGATGSGGTPAPVSGVDGVTGASMSSSTGGTIPQTGTATWNGKDASGAVVPDGTYIVCVEDYNGNYYSNVASFSFTKNSTPSTTTPANISIFSNVRLQWTSP